MNELQNLSLLLGLSWVFIMLLVHRHVGYKNEKQSEIDKLVAGLAAEMKKNTALLSKIDDLQTRLLESENMIIAERKRKSKNGWIAANFENAKGAEFFRLKRLPYHGVSQPIANVVKTITTSGVIFGAPVGYISFIDLEVFIK